MPEEYNDKTKEEIYDELHGQIVDLKQQLSIAHRALFGQKSERFIPPTPQGQLSIFEKLDAETPPLDPTVKQTITYQRNKPLPKERKRQALPADLPRINVYIEPEEDVTGWKKNRGRNYGRTRLYSRLFCCH